jgi:hypothetical protein
MRSLAAMLLSPEAVRKDPLRPLVFMGNHNDMRAIFYITFSVSSIFSSKYFLGLQSELHLF